MNLIISNNKKREETQTCISVGGVETFTIEHLTCWWRGRGCCYMAELLLVLSLLRQINLYCLIKSLRHYFPLAVRGKHLREFVQSSSWLAGGSLLWRGGAGQVSPRKQINCSYILSAATSLTTGSNKLEEASSNECSIKLSSLLKASLKLAVAFNNFVLHHHLDRDDRCVGRAAGESKRERSGRWRMFTFMKSWSNLLKRSQTINFLFTNKKNPLQRREWKDAWTPHSLKMYACTGNCSAWDNSSKGHLQLFTRSSTYWTCFSFASLIIHHSSSCKTFHQNESKWHWTSFSWLLRQIKTVIGMVWRVFDAFRSWSSCHQLHHTHT